MTPSLECVYFRVKFNTLGHGLRLDVISSQCSGRELDFASLPAGLGLDSVHRQRGACCEGPVEY